MTKHTINTTVTNTFIVNHNGDQWIVGGNGFINSATNGIYEDAAFRNNTISVNGAIDVSVASGDDAARGIFANGLNTKILVGSNGEIDAIDGIIMDGKGQSLVNKGLIVGSSNGVYVETNHRVSISNYGTISGDDALNLGGGNDHVSNHGSLLGNINLGGGNDTLDTRDGRVTGAIYGSTGDDTLYVSKASLQLSENDGEGFDTVKSTVSYELQGNVEKLVLLGSKSLNGTGNFNDNWLYGNSGNNKLKGGDGMDHLFGGKGNDTLTGGADVDFFHFATGGGKDVITDFQDTIDQIDLSAWKSITSFTDLIKHHATNQGADVLIHAGSDSLLIKGIHKADLDAIDFFDF